MNERGAGRRNDTRWLRSGGARRSPNGSRRGTRSCGRGRRPGSRRSNAELRRCRPSARPRGAGPRRAWRSPRRTGALGPTRGSSGAWLAAASDDDAAVRRRGRDCARARVAVPVDVLVDLVADDDTWVAEARCRSVNDAARVRVASSLVPVATSTTTRSCASRRSPRSAPGRSRRPARGARRLFGQAGDPSACGAGVGRVRRRNGRGRVVAREDPDWQVRQAAEVHVCGD